MNNKGQIFFLPMFFHSEPKKCPKCHKEEDKKEVCKHCGYEYPKNTESYPFWWLSLGIDIGIFFLIFYIGQFLEPFMNEWWSMPLSLVGLILAIILMLIVWPLFMKEGEE